MFKLNEEFLNELGLGILPSAEKNKMLAQILETLEMRVGMKLASGMSNEQLDEFEGFIGGDVSKATAFLDHLDPNWRQSPGYLKSLDQARLNAEKQGRALNPDAVTSEHAALRWLEANFPEYKKVVASELEKLKTEIKQAAPTIMSEINQGPLQQPPQEQPPQG